jgi:hypothetical protein
MVFRLQIGNQVVPEQTPEVILNRCGVPVYSVLACALALCTVTHKGADGSGGHRQGGPDAGVFLQTHRRGSGSDPTPAAAYRL